MRKIYALYKNMHQFITALCTSTQTRVFAALHFHSTNIHLGALTLRCSRVLVPTVHMYTCTVQYIRYTCNSLLSYTPIYLVGSMAYAPKIPLLITVDEKRNIGKLVNHRYQYYAAMNKITMATGQRFFT